MSDAADVLGWYHASGFASLATKWLPKVASGRLIELEAVTPAAVADALATGQLSPEETKHITSALAKLAELEDLASVKQRLVQIEALLRGDQ